MPVRTAKERRVKCSGFVALLAALLLALALPAAAGAGVDVWFLRNGKPVSVPRGGTTVRSAVEGLLAGWEAIRQRRHGHTPSGRVFRTHAKEVRIATKPRRLVETDGSVVGTTPIDISIRPAALAVLVPTDEG